VRVVREAPAWLVSLVFHMALVIVLAFIAIPSLRKNVLMLEATYSERIGEQLESILPANSMDLERNLETDMAIADRPVDDPFAAPPDLQSLDVAGSSATSHLAAPTIGTMLNGRQPGAKKAMLAVYGGTNSTEASVRMALEWLRRQQQRDGSWRLDEPFPDGGIDESRTAATAMALLAFLGAGHTHREGDYLPVVGRGVNALLRMQDEEGNFFREGPRHHRLYSHAMATIVACELYAMTQDEQVGQAAQKAIKYCGRIQAPEGGWRYDPKVDSDVSVTGWFSMAFQSGRMAGLEVSNFTLQGIGQYLDSAQLDEGARYAYQAGGPARLSMTAEGLLCRQYLGWPRSDPRLRKGCDEMLANPIAWDQPNVYYWYYATQVLHHMGGQDWFRWNAVMRQAIPERQIASGQDAGSWAPTDDPNDRQGGRLYVTCLCTYMLEVYYRHLPLYAH